MKSSRYGWRTPWAIVSLLLLTFVTRTLCGQMGLGRAAARPSSTQVAQHFVPPQLLNAESDPTLRYPVAKLSGSLLGNVSNGWLDISRSKVRYEVVQPAAKEKDAFDTPTAAITDIKRDGTYNLLRLYTPQKKQTLFYQAQQDWGTVHNAGTFWSASAAGAQGTTSIQRALQNFDVVLAEVKAALTPPAPVVSQPINSPPVKPEPAPTPSQPASAPIIVITSPAGAAADQSVATDSSTLVIRGAVMDNSGMPVVTINGTPANMRPQSAQAAEFWSDSLTLKPGDNPMRINASNTAHAEARLEFTVHYSPKAAPLNPKALSKADILSLLQGAVPSERVAEIVKERGIKFTPTLEDLNDLRTAGAGDDLIQALQQAGPSK
jgi:hypothetical protein